MSCDFKRVAKGGGGGGGGLRGVGGGGGSRFGRALYIVFYWYTDRSI